VEKDMHSPIFHC